ncbi:hypothetical protein COCMIDRAFT_100737, partial [Bipolaris oryzae ATCC 44560]
TTKNPRDAVVGCRHRSHCSLPTGILIPLAWIDTPQPTTLVVGSLTASDALTTRAPRLHSARISKLKISRLAICNSICARTPARCIPPPVTYTYLINVDRMVLHANSLPF